MSIEHDLKRAYKPNIHFGKFIPYEAYESDEFINSKGNKTRDIHYCYNFSNGFGASVIRNWMSYGSKDNLFELAVLDGHGNLYYGTDITNDVLGYLTVDEVTDTLSNIEKLDTRGRLS